ncbi:MAG TPA: glycosyl hydrolase, partial [Cystobacter sp.]
MNQRKFVGVVAAVVAAIGCVVSPMTAKAAAPTLSATVDDGVLGTGTNQFQYTGNWVNCGCNGGSFRYAYQTGDKVTFRFTGSQVKLFGYKEPVAGIASISIDGGTPVDADIYSATKGFAAYYTSPLLADTAHTVTVTVSGRKNSAATGTTVSLDKAEVYTGGSPTTPTEPPPGNLLGSVGARSGLAWNSCMFPLNRSGSASSYAAALNVVEAGRGRFCDIEQAAQWHGNWNDVKDLYVLSFMNPNLTSVVDTPPFPGGSGAAVNGSWAEAASGAYDAYYRQMGANAASYANRAGQEVILRFAWEFNGCWYHWTAGKDCNGVWKANNTQFKTAWQRAYTNIKAGAGSAANRVLMSWSLGGTDTSAGYDFKDLYPGDAYVDLVGIDVYDSPGSKTLTSFNSA